MLKSFFIYPHFCNHLFPSYTQSHSDTVFIFPSLALGQRHLKCSVHWHSIKKSQFKTDLGQESKPFAVHEVPWACLLSSTFTNISQNQRKVSGPIKTQAKRQLYNGYSSKTTLWLHPRFMCCLFFTRERSYGPPYVVLRVWGLSMVI